MLTKLFSRIKTGIPHDNFISVLLVYLKHFIYFVIMQTIRKVRRVEAVRVEDEEYPPLLSDYLEKIAGDIYIVVSNFAVITS